MDGEPDQRGPGAQVLHGDCLRLLGGIAEATVDAVVTDPPYGLSDLATTKVAETVTTWLSGDRAHVPAGRGFLAKGWDSFVPPPAVWDECFRVLRPGGHIAVFAGSRTADLMGLSLRLAGFELRDSLAWLYASGMPHGNDVAKSIDRLNGVEPTVVSSGRPVKRMIPGADQNRTGDWTKNNGRTFTPQVTRPTSDRAAPWQGWNTALKPAFEPILLARKPLAESSVARNVVEYGTGAINVGACRIPHRDEADLAESMGKNQHAGYANPNSNKHSWSGSFGPRVDYDGTAGRWPANVLLDEDRARALEAQRPGASRFFFCSKASAAERVSWTRPDGRVVKHPTVKPLDLMAWLVRLVTPPGGLVLDPFAGSGTTLEAALRCGFDVIGVEAEADYLPLVAARIERARGHLSSAATGGGGR